VRKRAVVGQPLLAVLGGQPAREIII
jgi:hypothetical protein